MRPNYEFAICVVVRFIYISKRKRITMDNHKMLHHVEREKEGLTKLSSTKKVDERIQSMRSRVTFFA